MGRYFKLNLVGSRFWQHDNHNEYINKNYESKGELLDLEEEKSDIEDKIEERRAQGKSYEDLEERRNDVQDEIDNVREEG